MHDKFFIAQDDMLAAVDALEAEAGRLADDFEARMEALLDRITDLRRAVLGKGPEEDV